MYVYVFPSIAENVEIKSVGQRREKLRRLIDSLKLLFLQPNF